MRTGLFALLGLMALLGLCSMASALPKPAAASSSGKNSVKGTNSSAFRFIDDSVTLGNVSVRFRINAPSQAVVQGSPSSGSGRLGVHVFLHGDGGSGFFTFPNKQSQSDLIGVALLAPNNNRRWGGGGGLTRPDGPLHSAIINQFIQQELPKHINFDSSRVFFTGVSGGSLLLSGFFLPQFGANFKNAGALLLCGGMPPQVAFSDQGQFLQTFRVHWESTQNDLVELQNSIPDCIKAYEKQARTVGISDSVINQQLTADATSVGGHCAFDGVGFTSGVQVLVNSLEQVLLGNGVIPALHNLNVRVGVVGNEDRLFKNPPPKGARTPPRPNRKSSNPVLAARSFSDLDGIVL
ncbi:uncharacterized protein BJ171DRAFT_42476 [Polychytrium aggregatum]|uniref:uncharacterized protein n=1 Tax=Polychytrium aggregatum TaxID=110093 RepID=UPI0022FDB99C|nr:uncharacterized protein BJ171DRAFT_42476 [Polychytrium aggregatum]KAI9206176.1 hypothetical protein BJ171DRAFT_42476 [Polychytrium aggregatum]